MIRLGYYYGMILLLNGTVKPIVLGEVSIAFLILATILLFIGYTGLIVLSFKLENVEGESLYMVAGILFIVGIFPRHSRPCRVDTTLHSAREQY
jgi:hypothetical protein